MLSVIVSNIVAFYYNWRLAFLVMPIYIFVSVVINTLIAKVQASISKKELDIYATAANIAEEVLYAIRTVFAFSGERVEIERYHKCLMPVKNIYRIKGLAYGIGEGTIRFMFFASCGLSYYFGVLWVLNDRDEVNKQFTPASVIIVNMK